ncbi:hypothetical protein SCHPADRAFT_903702 [Schizopora paradoxa]|uniref:Copper acquisition factor BIM1-like domain-containing protein n=1 Tax=Schizopora paradoxa TaxID=27342 RepID=A0A0H2RQU2_9AGAM|nr:hypothetical protein SCHPADRAFT_903702 [Schizopora paradoxa]
MMFKVSSPLLVFAAVASAHFQLQFPVPRGAFVASNEPNFCDGYQNSVNNRSTFPLNGGFISYKSGHPHSTNAVLISIDQDPQSFSAFNTSSTGVQLPFAVPFFELNTAGTFCFPLNIGDLNIQGVTNGSNVTIQVMYNGGDGNLFQCSDLTLVEDFSIPSNISCANNTATSTSTSPSSTSTSSNSSDATPVHAQWLATVGLIGIVIFIGLSGL